MYLIKTRNSTSDGWLYLTDVHNPTIRRVLFADVDLKISKDSDVPVLIRTTSFAKDTLKNLQQHVPVSGKVFNFNIDKAREHEKILSAALKDHPHPLHILKAEPHHAWLIDYYHSDGSRTCVLTDEETILMSGSKTIDRYKGSCIPTSIPENKKKTPRLNCRLCGTPTPGASIRPANRANHGSSYIWGDVCMKCVIHTVDQLNNAIQNGFQPDAANATVFKKNVEFGTPTKQQTLVSDGKSQ